MRKVDPDFGRYQRLTSLVSDILRMPVPPAYVIFPELGHTRRSVLELHKKLEKEFNLRSRVSISEK